MHLHIHIAKCNFDSFYCSAVYTVRMLNIEIHIYIHTYMGRQMIKFCMCMHRTSPQAVFLSLHKNVIFGLYSVLTSYTYVAILML